MSVTQPTATPWLLRAGTPTQARCRLFCFPFAGGSASAFRTWHSAFPPEIEVCAVQLPGREQRIGEPLFTTLESLVNALIPVLLPYTDLPFALFGYSMGTLISLELAHRLEREHGLSPEHLFVAARRPPHLPDLDPPLHHLPEDELIAELRRFQGTPEEVLQNRDLMRLLLPILRSDLAICETYRYLDRAPLGCPISVFGGVDDPHIKLVDLIAWRKHTARAFTLKLFPGDHFFLFSATSSLTQTIIGHLQSCCHELSAESSAHLCKTTLP